MDEISEAADVSARTFFNYFPGKDEALLGDLPTDRKVLAARIVAAPSEASAFDALRLALDDVVEGDRGEPVAASAADQRQTTIRTWCWPRRTTYRPPNSARPPRVLTFFRSTGGAVGVSALGSVLAKPGDLADSGTAGPDRGRHGLTGPSELGAAPGSAGDGPSSRTVSVRCGR
ncbi:TetR family transcriptional regulator [Micromonospora sp. WMMD1076]|uniref:TetR family transcriptional regulator n=1 Tax=Micromonospora sp. WMMD1076 TaxID=3016103 RepID=UPI00249A2FC6|nr:TetR family transcriptional regulator [Micromonospora sp. WMMD1076]WFF05244.1 TetR family transcriptional regulator [Micromonospora sp. WMMD1076]